MTEDWQPPKDVKPWIVCAAVKSKSIVITGARHFDTIMRKQIERCSPEETGCWEQGFIDQWGRFYTRVEAMEIVKSNGQPFNRKRNGSNGPELFSEGLY